MKTALTKRQNLKFGPEFYKERGETYRITANVQHDDDCGNGHNTFAITADIQYKAGNGRWRDESGGCLHDEIAKRFPELAPLIKWHLCSTDGPMHYVANTVYHASAIPEKQDKWYFYLEGKLIRIVDGLEEREAMVRKYGHNTVFTSYPNPMAKVPDLEAARNCAIWPDATLKQLKNVAALEARLPELMAEFKAAVESLGMQY